MKKNKKLPKLNLRREVVQKLTDDEAKSAAGVSGYCTWVTNDCGASSGFLCGY